MKTKTFLIFICISCFIISFQSADNKPIVYINNYKTEVTEGMFINCLTINELTTTVPLTEKMKSYDVFKIELHRFGETEDIIAASKIVDPKSKEFQKKYANKNLLKLKVLAEEDDFGGSDLEPNTTIFPANSTVNMVFCKSHDLKNCSFYLIVKGYTKTGEKNRFGEDIFDNGADLTSKSVVFKSWEDRTKR
jgi:hypothetical protein